MKKINRNPFKLIEFGALALIGASTLIGYTKRAKQARIQHDTLEYSDENLEYSDEKIKALIKEGYIPIATAEELNSIRNTSPRFYGVGTKWKAPYTGGLDKKYVQVANIDLSKYGDWTPIGTLRDNFRGTYDGGNYVITGLVVKDEDEDYQGLFGRTNGATISNVVLEDVNVTGANNVGGLVGYACVSSISNSYATGSVTGRGQVGGLVGGANNSMISNSYAEVLVEGTNQVGGLVGVVGNNTEITNSYSTGEVTGSGEYVGGLVGLVQSNSMISSSYAKGSVKGSLYIGGLVGSAVTSAINNSYSTGAATGSSSIGSLVGVADRSTIETSYAKGEVNGSGERVGALVGYVTRKTNVYNSYWDKETTGRTYSSGVGSGKTTDEMKLKETYKDWDFVDVWKIDEGNDYPTLR